MSKKDYTLPVGKIGSNKVEGFKNLQSIFGEHIWNERKKPIKDRVLKAITKEQLDNAKAENAVIGFHANYSLRRTEKVNFLTGIIVYDIDFIKGVDKVLASKEIEDIIDKALKPNRDKVLFYYRTPSGGLKIALLVDYFGKEEDDFKIVYEHFKERLYYAISPKIRGFKYCDFDMSCNKIISSHYASYDPDAVLNLSAKVWDDFDFSTLKKKSEDSVGTNTSIQHIDKGNAYYHFLIQAIINYYKEFPKLLNLGNGYLEQNVSLMYALKNTFNENDAMIYGKMFFSIKGQFDEQRFLTNWDKQEAKDVDKKATISSILWAAIQTGFNTKVNGQEYLKKAAEFVKDWEYPTIDAKIKVKKKMSEKAQELNDLLVDDKPNLIVAKTSIGKTYWAINKYCREFGNNVIMGTPLVTLTKDVEMGYTVPSLYGESDLEMKNHTPASPDALGATYDSIQKVFGHIKTKEYTLIIDEAHNLIKGYSFRPVMKDIIKYFKYFKRVLLLTATPIRKEVMDLVPELRYVNEIRVDNEIVEQKRLHIIETENIEVELERRVGDSKKQGYKTGIFYQNCEGNETLAAYLKVMECDSLIVNSYTKYDDAVQDLSKNQKMGEKDLIICTYAGAEGQNYNDENIKEIHVIGTHPSSDIQQYVSRFRRALASLDIYLCYTPNTTFKLDYYEPRTLTYAIKKEANRVKNEHLLSTIKTIRESNHRNIDDKVIQDYIIAANKSMARFDISKVFATNPYHVGKQVTIDALGVATTVQQRLDNAEKRNPFLLIEGLVKYGFDIVEINKLDDTKTNGMKNEIFWDKAVEIIEERLDEVHDERDYEIFSNELSTLENIKENNFSDSSMVRKNLYDYYKKVKELHKNGYTNAQAFKIANDTGKGVRKMNDEYLKPLHTRRIIDADLIDVLPMVKKLSSSIEFGKDYSKEELLEKIHIIGEQTGNKKFKKAKRPMDILKYVFTEDNTRDTNKNGKATIFRFTDFAYPKEDPENSDDRILKLALEKVEKLFKDVA